MEEPEAAAETLTYYGNLAAAYVRGKRLREEGSALCPRMKIEQVLRIGREDGLDLHAFKRTMGLPRVRKVIGMLKTIRPQSIVDIGSGRGVFLWPLMDAFPHVWTGAVDIDPSVVDRIQTVADGGIWWLSAFEGDVQQQLPFPDGSADVVTVLEVLEHLPRPDLAVREALRIADRFVAASVPSKEDNNPGHINLFSASMLKAMFLSAEASSVKLDGVLNHIVLLARK